MSIRVNITKKLFGSNLNVDFYASDTHTGLLGDSGCGKSMTLKCIAGIETPDSGYIEINGKTVFDSKKKINIAPQHRETGFLFQNYALFPHYTAQQNITAVLAARGIPRKERKERAQKLIHKLGLSGLEDRKPLRMSGGQQQRLALARLLASDPKIILLDEPFSALDATVKEKVQEELNQFLSDFSGTVLFVTHNRDEAFSFCHDMIILSDGRVVEQGKAETLFRSPASLTAARLTGCRNIAACYPASKAENESKIDIPEWNMRLETSRVIPQGIQYVGIRARHIYEATPERMKTSSENMYTLPVTSRTQALFQASEHLSSGTGSIVWSYSRDELSSSSFPENRTIIIPAEKILLLH